MLALVLRARRTRWLAVVVANLRILVGFAFVPAGLKKLLGQPFTDPQNTGPFHDFLHAFFATGAFYRFVGIMQLAIALLLMTQRYATLGALLGLPVIAAITVFCWSTMVVPTATVATLMLLGVIALVLWDYPKWHAVLGRETKRELVVTPVQARIDMRLWAWCGVGVIALYLGLCLAMGEVYRPRKVKPDEAAFYIFPAIMLLPIVTFVIDQRRARR